MANLFAILLLSLPIQSAEAADAGRCYHIRVESPEMARDSRPRTETWCYRNLTDPVGGVFIFNAEHKSVRPELAMLVERDGMLTHGSLMAGRITTHRLRYRDFNPFTVPLREPGAAAAAVFAEVDEKSVDETLNLFLAQRSRAEMDFSVLQSPTAASSAVRPWRGYWWPYKNRPLQNGPYARFDQFVRQRTGSNPGAVAWEDRNHRYKGIWWEGHCNGWAAASVLRTEPTYPRVDPASGIVFKVSDQKAYYSGIDYCVNSAFFGERYRGARNNSRDILPHVFHKTLIYYIGALRKPVAMDYRSDVTVDNHIISGYRMNIVPVGTNVYAVTTTLTVHRYDARIVETPGVAPVYQRVYSYQLRTDDSGNPVGGSWNSANPDFLWVPLSPRACNSNNPGLKREWVSAIMSLPAR